MSTKAIEFTVFKRLTRKPNFFHEAVRCCVIPCFVDETCVCMTDHDDIESEIMRGIDTSASARPDENARWRRFVAPAILLCLLGLGYALGLQKYFTLQSIAEHRDTFSTFTQNNLTLALLAFIGIYTGAVAVSFPGASVLTIVAGLLFGWWLGGLATIIAATLGATLVFSVARSFLGDVLAKRAGPRLQAITKGFTDDAFNYMLLVNIAPAFTNMKLRSYVLATFLGIMPGTFAFAFVGAGLGSVLTAQEQAQAECVAQKSLADCPFELSLGSIITPQLLAALVALGVVALIPVALKKWKTRHAV